MFLEPSPEVVDVPYRSTASIAPYTDCPPDGCMRDWFCSSMSGHRWLEAAALRNGQPRIFKESRVMFGKAAEKEPRTTIRLNYAYVHTLQAEPHCLPDRSWLEIIWSWLHRCTHLG
jgi:hypothetical protein